jgi:Cu2+-exporting ATPase
MSCAACQAHVEKAVSKVPGVTGCSVSLLTNSMTVEGSASAAEIEKAVAAAGYGAEKLGAAATEQSASQKLAAEEAALIDRETPRMLRRLVWSIAVLLVLMYFSMGHMLLALPVPVFLHNPVCMGLLQMLLSLIVLLINRRFFTQGFGALLHRATTWDHAGRARLGRLLRLQPRGAVRHGLGAGERRQRDRAAYGMKHICFESAAMIPTLITVGKDARGPIRRAARPTR